MCVCGQPLVKFKSHLYFEEKDCVSEAEKNLKPAKGSKVRVVISLGGMGSQSKCQLAFCCALSF